MNPLLIIAIPLRLVIVGMILNSLDLGFVQPPSSPEQDPVKRLTAEKESYRKFFSSFSMGPIIVRVEPSPCPIARTPVPLPPPAIDR
jgi:hypothetical protein